MINQPTVINRRVRGEVGMPVMTEPAPLIEQRFDLKDALAHASWLHVLWRHPDKISLATQAQMVNVIAPIHTTPDGMVRETTFYPLAVARRCAQGTGLNVEVITEAGLECAAAPGGSLPALDAAATCDPASGRLHLSLVNRLPDSELLVDLDGMTGPVQRITLWADDPAAVNSPDDPDRVVPIEARKTPTVPVASGQRLHLCRTPAVPHNLDGAQRRHDRQRLPVGCPRGSSLGHAGPQLRRSARF